MGGTPQRYRPVLVALIASALVATGCKTLVGGGPLLAPSLRGVGADVPSSPAISTVRWHASKLANEVWVIDACARAEDRATDPFCAVLKDAPSTALDTWRRIADAWAAANPSKPADPPHSLYVDMLPPAQSTAAERFVVAFYRADRLDQAFASLTLGETDTQALAKVFGDLKPALTALSSQAEYLKGGLAGLELLATDAEMSGFLSTVARFYGVETRAPKTLHIQLLWNPSLRVRAQVIGEQVLLPMSRAHFDDARQLEGMLGVAVHEIGHAFAASMTDVVRHNRSDRLVHELGIMQPRHANIFDEATQVAIGNVVFMNRAFGASTSFDDRLYGYEPDNPVPHAIDTLARHLAEIAARHLGTRKGFRGPYFDEAIETHRKVFGDAPRHHSRVALILSNTTGLTAAFKGLFWGRARTTFDLTDIAEFDRQSKEVRTVSRWFLVDAKDETGSQALAKRCPAVATALSMLRRNTACFVSKRRHSRGGFDLAIVGETVADARELLNLVHGMNEMPSGPWCFKRS